mmetsp:Transcript_15116/g.44123  ORF Transcript_15116/g.44123 Transcript_15116/m.44123 type:complete len:243 (-) Transcript_15116:31-759(-)
MPRLQAHGRGTGWSFPQELLQGTRNVPTVLDQRLPSCVAVPEAHLHELVELTRVSEAGLRLDEPVCPCQSTCLGVPLPRRPRLVAGRRPWRLGNFWRRGDPLAELLAALEECCYVRGRRPVVHDEGPPLQEGAHHGPAVAGLPESYGLPTSVRLEVLHEDSVPCVTQGRHPHDSLVTAKSRRVPHAHLRGWRRRLGLHGRCSRSPGRGADVQGRGRRRGRGAAGRGAGLPEPGYRQRQAGGG